VDLVGMASRQSIASTHVEEFADAQQPVATEFVRAPDPFDRVGPWGREIAGLTLEFGLRLGARTACVTSIRRAGVWHPADRLAMGVRAAMLGERAARLLHAGEQPNWLTDRETEVLNRLTEGYSESEVADQLGRSRFTIHDHVKNMYRKLHAENRADLVRLAMGGQNEPFRSESAAPADLSVSLIAS
jgi:DNA-binding CsgD family transcriptional regulator